MKGWYAVHGDRILETVLTGQRTGGSRTQRSLI